MALTWMGSTEWLRMSFRTGRSSRCSVVTSPSLNLEENLRGGRETQNLGVWTKTTTGTHLPARPAICRACEVLMVSICFSPFSLMLGLTRLLKMMRLMLLQRDGGEALNHENHEGLKVLKAPTG